MRKMNSIPVEEQEVQCRFKDGVAFGLYELSRGCAVFPDDRQQALCCHHAERANPIGEMNLVLIYHPELYKFFIKSTFGSRGEIVEQEE